MTARILFMLPMLGAALGAAGVTPHLLEPQPIRFEENRGQAAAEYDYLARTARGTLGLTRSGMDLLFDTGIVHTRFLGTHRHARLEASEPLPLRTSFFRGSDERAWAAAVANYGRVRYRELYPGIDLVFYERASQLEYDFDIAAGADPASIRFAIEGCDAIRIDAEGDLVLTAAGGEVRWKKPEVHQTIEGRDIPVSGSYALEGHTVTLRLGSYNTSLALTVDPVLSFSTYLGGSGNEVIRGVAVDGAGNIYVTGSTTSSNLTATGWQKQFGGLASTVFGAVTVGDAFVAKYSPAGTLVYLTYLGGSAEDVGAALAVDKDGNAYVTGYTDSSNFPVTASAAQKTWAGRGGNVLVRLGDAFVAKIGPNGDNLIYSTFLGGTQDDYGGAIAVDTAGNAYVTGGTLSNDLPVTANAAQPDYKRSGTQADFPRFAGPLLTVGDGFVAKLNATGSSFLSLTYLGGSADDLPWALALDSAGNVYVAGNTLSGNFPTTAGAWQTKFGGTDFTNNYFFNLGDGFVTKLNNSLSTIVYSTFLGGAGDDAIMAIAVDGTGAAYVAGATDSSNLGTIGAFRRFYTGPNGLPFTTDQLIGDGFVAKINPDGKSLGFFTYLGGGSDDMAMAIALDATGNIVVTGSTQSLDFPVSTDALQAKNPQTAARQGGGGPGFLAILDATGQKLIYGSYFGGSKTDVPTSLAIDSSGAIIVVGAAISPDFPTAKPMQAGYGGGSSDAFVAKFTGFAKASTAPTTSGAGIANVASYQSGSVSPGEIVVIFGSNMGPSQLATYTITGGKFDKALAGTTVTFDGVAAPLIYTSAGQISAIVPYSVAGNSTTQVVIQYNGQSSAPVSVPVVAAVPGLFTSNNSGKGQGAILNQDTSINSPGNPAGRDSIVVLFVTGEGQTSPAGTDGLLASSVYPAPVQPVTVTMGGRTLTTLYAGAAPGEVAGVMQVNVRIPADLTPGDAVPVAVTVGNASSPAGVTLAVK